MTRDDTARLAAAARDDVDLRRATGADVRGLAEVLADAFAEDPIYAWLMPGDRRHRDRLRRFFALQLRTMGLERGAVWTTRQALGGALIAASPGCWRLPVTALVRHGRDHGRIFGHRAPRALDFLVRLEQRHLREPHQYVATVGVAPDLQGQGLGSQLFGPLLAQADRDRLPAYIEASTARSAALYERLGFVTTDELRARDSPPVWLMVRQPV